MTLQVRKFGDPVLKSRASEVTVFDGALASLADEMFETMHENDGVGLAGNQVGRLQRILVAEYEEERFVLINPEVLDRSSDTEPSSEGCLSIPGIKVDVERPTNVTVRAMSLDGESFEIEAEGLLARIFLHEIDHLDGVMILDRTDRASRREAMREMRERLLDRT